MLAYYQAWEHHTSEDAWAASWWEMSTRVGDRLNVVFVSPGSPASHAGVCEGDEVISIDGRSLDADFFASRPRLGVRPPGSRLKLGLSDGRAVELVLGDYY